MKNWTTADIPSHVGRLAIITGGAEGIGFACARALAVAGCDVIIASRHADRGALAVSKIKSECARSNVRFEILDLASIDRIRTFAKRIRDEHTGLQILINNAGVMTPPKRLTTADGFEVQFGVNFLGHFALTGLLLPLLRQSDGARIVTLSSIANRDGYIDFDDLHSEHRYRPMASYAQSKLADLLFSFELQRRSEAAKWNISSLATHPGLSRTNLFFSGPGSFGKMSLVRRILGPILFQSAAQGALPTLYAATSPDAVAGGYYGPNRLGEIRGNVTRAVVPPQAEDSSSASKLWTVAEQLTGVSFLQE